MKHKPTWHKPTWEDYGREKKRIQRKNLTPKQYEEEIRKLTKRMMGLLEGKR